jgi:tRNA uridine 5-carboxymethylaminomethyl modification enzyme
LATDRGLLLPEEIEAAERRIRAEEAVMSFAEETAISPDTANPVLERIGSTPIEEPVRLAELGKRPGIALEELLAAAGYQVREGESDWSAIELRYGGYIALDDFELSNELEFGTMESLSFEAREKLSRRRPTSLGQAGRIPGVSPSDIQNLVMEVLKRRCT